MINVPALLHAHVEAWRNKPFRWGEADCCLFVQEWIARCGGPDHAAPYRGRYHSEDEARNLIGCDLGQFARSLFGEPKAGPFACRGDVVFLDVPLAGGILGICTGPNAAFVGENGMQFLRLNHLAGFWPIGGISWQR